MKLISWNIQRGRGLNNTCSIARVVANLRHMADFDVLCLQEVASGYTDLPGCDGGNQFMQLARFAAGLHANGGHCHRYHGRRRRSAAVW